MLEKALYWAAGFVDADGSICISDQKTRHGGRFLRPEVTAVGVKLHPFEILQGLFGGTVHRERRATDTNNKRDYWRWMVTGDRAINAATWLQPYLQIKHRQAFLMQHWEHTPLGRPSKVSVVRDQIRHKQQEIRQRVCELNRVGRN